jgi:hypothetical protein
VLQTYGYPQPVRGIVLLIFLNYEVPNYVPVYRNFSLRFKNNLSIT